VGDTSIIDESWVGAAILKLRQQAAVARVHDVVLDGRQRPYNPTDPTDPVVVATRYELTADLLDEILLLWHRNIAIPVGIMEAAETLAENIMGVVHDA